MSLRAAAQHDGQPAPEVVLTAANSDTVIDQVRREQADLGFVEGPSAPRTSAARWSAHDTLTLVVRHDHPWARRRRPVSAQELDQTPLVSREHGSGHPGGARQRRCARRWAPRPSRRRPCWRCPARLPIRAAVLAGAGPAVLSELAVVDDLAVRRLRRVPVSGLDLTRVLRAIWLGPSTPPAGAVRDLVAHAVRLRGPA